MWELLRLVVLSAVTGLVTAADPRPVDGHLGADLLLPVEEACTYDGSYRFDLYNTQMIGAYDDGLQGLRRYRDRLTYDPETCTIALRGLRAQDGTTFTVRLYSARNHKATPHDITFQVTIRDPLTSRPSTKATIPPEAACNGTQASNDGVRGFLSFCFSLDSVVNAALYLLLLILQGCFNKLDEGKMYIANLVSFLITVISQVCSISTMNSENHYVWFLVVIPILLLIDVLRSLRDVGSTRSKTIARYLWIGLTLLAQVLFAVIVGLLNARCDNFFGQGSRVGFLFLSLFLSAVLRAGIFTIVYYIRCHTKEFKNVPLEDPTNTPGPTVKKVALVENECLSMVPTPGGEHSLPSTDVQRA